MIVLLAAFSLFHLAAGAASLAAAARLMGAEERVLWRSKWGLRIAQSIAWIYPALALACTILAWADFAAGRHDALPVILVPLAWLIAMGVMFAIVDLAEDGVIGNARARE